MSAKKKQVVYNALSKGKKVNSKSEKPKITTEHLEFLRTAEMLNEADVDADEFGGGLLASDGDDFKKKSSGKVRSGGKSGRSGEGLPSGASSLSSSEEIKEVAQELQEFGTNSTSQTSIEEAKRRHASGRSGEEAHKDYLGGGKGAGAKRVSAIEAHTMRMKLVRRRHRMDRCTYAALVLIVIVRLITTLEMVYEYEEYGIVLEYLKRLKRLNCTEILEYPISDLYPWTLCLYFLACCILPIVTRRDLTNVFVVWFFFQMLYTGYRFLIFQKYLYHREIFLTEGVVIMFFLHTLLDVFSFTIVMIRYYFWANPCLERNRFSNTLLGDYLVNEYIQFIVQSSFIRKKNAVQRATAFQVMTVVRKLKEKHRSSGVGPSESAIAKEVNSAIHALQDWKKFPSLRIIHSFEVKEKLMNEKLKQRRRRIREMKERFQELMRQAKQEDLKSRKGQGLKTDPTPSQNKVYLNKQGQAVGFTKSAMIKGAGGPSGGNKPTAPQGKGYADKRAELLQQSKQK